MAVFKGRSGSAKAEKPTEQALASSNIDAASVDLTPSTSSIKVVTEATAIVPSRDSVETDAINRDKPTYLRRDSLRGDIFDQPEPAAMLTAERLIDVSARNRQAPESGFRRFLYVVSFKAINLGDSLRVRER